MVKKQPWQCLKFCTDFLQAGRDRSIFKMKIDNKFDGRRKQAWVLPG